MKVRMPALFQDTEQPTFKEGMARAQGIELEDAYFLDGPVGRRVAVLDFDPETGALHPGAKLKPANGRKIREYDIRGEDYTAPEYRAVMVFGTVMKTILQFEHPRILGREVRWAFDGQQLLVVPRAGRWRNAFYQRESHSLQFFFFEHQGAEVFLSLSEDVVAHETGHAVLDGIAPDLHDASTPQSLAIHESVADLTALTRAMRNDELRDEVLRDPGWSITQTNAFTALAEEFGRALSESRTSYLRNAYNDASLDVNAGRDYVRDRASPHDLSQVLTGALYRVLVADYERNEKAALDAGLEPIPARGKALGTAAQRFEHFVFRALDYLPPGEATFADFVRAVLAADEAAYREPEHDAYRDVLRKEALRRHIVTSPNELVVETNVVEPALASDRTSLDGLVESDWYAHEFVNDNRHLVGVPVGLPFEVRPRLEVTRAYSHSASDDVAHEIVLEVIWERSEPNQLEPWLPPMRDVTIGSTLVIDRDTRMLRARLRTGDQPDQAAERDGFLRRLIDDDRLVAPRPTREDETLEQSVIVPSVRSGRMRLHGVASMLHVAADVWEG